MSWRKPVGGARNAPHEIRVEDVDGDVASPVQEIAVRVSGKAVFVLQLGVLHHANRSIHPRHDADVLVGLLLYDHLARHFRPRGVVQA